MKKTVITLVSLFMVLVNSVCAQEKQSFREWVQTPPMGWIVGIAMNQQLQRKGQKLMPTCGEC